MSKAIGHKLSMVRFCQAASIIRGSVTLLQGKRRYCTFLLPAVLFDRHTNRVSNGSIDGRVVLSILFLKIFP